MPQAVNAVLVEANGPLPDVNREVFPLLAGICEIDAPVLFVLLDAFEFEFQSGFSKK